MAEHDLVLLDFSLVSKKCANEEEGFIKVHMLSVSGTISLDYGSFN